MSILNKLKRKLEHQSSYLAKVAKEDIDILTRYMSSKNVPLWFRGTSYRQLAAADRLHNALLDDTEQATTYRVEECLRQIGLRPLVSSVEINKIILCSQKSDLAFLWFLWEAHYKTPGGHYSLNEELILSAISHLDMIPTMRALERILPPPQPTKREIAQLKKRKEQKKKDEQKRKRSARLYCKRNEAFIFDESFRKSPYFAEQRAPKLRPLTKFIKHPGTRVIFPSYEKYSDPFYKTPNESTRWFASYQLDPNKRIALGIINEQIANIFQNTMEDADNAVTEIIKNELWKIMNVVFAQSAASPEKEYEKTGRSLCLHHKCKEEDDRRRWLENRVREKQRCLDHFDVSTKCREESRQRVLTSLYKAIEQVKTKPQNVRIIGKNRVLAGDIFKEVESETKQDTRRCEINWGIDSSGYRTQEQVSNTECQENRYLLKMKDMSVTDMPTSSCCQVECDCSSKERFFVAAQEHLPCHFSYDKIFNFNDCDKLDINETIEQCLLENVSKSVRKKTTRNEPDMDEAVKQCIKQMWCDGVASVNTNITIDKSEDAAKHRGIISYDLEYYDPDDRDLMLRLLKDGMEYLKRDRRLVLPVLPEAYKLPVLFEFILRRFGKVYTKKELLNSYDDSLKMFKALQKWVKLLLPRPPITEYVTRAVGTYACRDYYIKRLEDFKQGYYAKLNEHIMQIARIGWFISTAYLCTNGPPRDTYFAYMPEHLGQVLHFHPWRSCETRDMHALWYNRQKKKGNN